MNTKRQFRLRDMLIAVTWLSACFACWVYLANNADWLQVEGFPAFHARFEGSTGLVAMGGAFVGWSAVRGQHKLGVQWGVLVLAVFAYELIRM